MLRAFSMFPSVTERASRATLLEHETTSTRVLRSRFTRAIGSVTASSIEIRHSCTRLTLASMGDWRIDDTACCCSSCMELDWDEPPPTESSDAPWTSVLCRACNSMRSWVPCR